MIKILIILLLLSGCAKDLDLNPWTTILKHTLKGTNDKNK
jgi:Tfp pilus assembly protein PilP